MLLFVQRGKSVFTPGAVIFNAIAAIIAMQAIAPELSLLVSRSLTIVAELIQGQGEVVAAEVVEAAEAEAGKVEVVVEKEEVVVDNKLRDSNTAAPNNSTDSHNSSMMSMADRSHSI